MSLLIIFKGAVDTRWRKVPGVEAKSVEECNFDVGGKFVVVVDDVELARRLRAAFFTREELEEVLRIVEAFQ